MARVGQQIVGLDRDRLPDRVAMGVLTRVFPPGLVDEVVAAAKVGEQRIRILPARLVVYYTLAMIVFFQSSYPQVWVKLIGGLDWAKSFRDRVTVGMPPSPAAISKARARLGWKVMADLLDRVGLREATEDRQVVPHIAGGTARPIRNPVPAGDALRHRVDARSTGSSGSSVMCLKSSYGVLG